MSLFADTLFRIPPPDVVDTDIIITWGEPYSLQLFSNFSGPYTPHCYVSDQGSPIPDGLILEPTGLLHGITTSIDAETALEVIVDVGNSIYVYNIPITIIGLPHIFPSSCEGSPYSASLNPPEGMEGPYVWSITSGSLPLGLQLENTSSGIISGIPLNPGNYIFDLTVNEFSTKCLIKINAGPSLINRSASYESGAKVYQLLLPMCFTSQPYGYYFGSLIENVDQLTALYIDTGTLPEGLYFDTESYMLSGNYTGSYNPASFLFTIYAESSNGCHCYIDCLIICNSPLSECAIDEKSYLLTIDGLRINPTGLHSVCEGGRYGAVIHAAGGSAPYTFSITSGTLPNGIEFSSAGVLSGWANDLYGDYPFQITVEDSIGASHTFDLSITIDKKPSITTLTLPNAEQNVAYSVLIEGTNTTEDAEYSLAAFRLLPEGLVLNTTTGEISGTPTEVGTYRFLIELNNLNQCYDRKYYDLTITGDTSVYTPPSISGTPFNICKASYYSFMPSVSEGTPPYTYSISSGTLPPGLNIVNTTGELIGYPTTAGVFSFDLKVTDSMFLTDTLSCSIEVYDSPNITLTTLPTAVWNNPYECLITYSGGVTPFAWSIQEPLPEGLVFNTSTGLLSGTPFVSGQYILTASIRDANSCTAKKQFILNIQGPPSITTTKLSSACQGLYYKKFINVEGGTSPYLWFITSNNLPPDSIKLNPYTGQLSGIPKTFGTFTFSIGIKDINGMYDQKDYDLLVRPKEECAGNIDPTIPPDEAGYIEIERERLVSLPSSPAIVKDPFHQKYLIEYLPTPYIEDK